MFGKLFFNSIAAFLCGVFVHSHFLDFSLTTSLLIFILITSLLWNIFSPWYKNISFIVIAFILGFLFFQNSIDPVKNTELDYFSQNKIELKIEGVISQRPTILGERKKLSIDLEKIESLPDISFDQKILLNTYDIHDYKYGDRVSFKTVLEKPESFISESGREFDYVHYLEKDGIYYLGRANKIEITEHGEKNLLSRLYSFKDSFLEKIYSYVSRPQSALLAGVLLGEKTALGEDLENSFRATGLMHIVVLSGYNVSLIIMAVMIFLRFLPLYTRSIIATLAIILFALLVGAGPTVVRASIMAFFIVLGKVLGREYKIERALVFAAFLMVLWNPWVLYFDISFQMSFLATYGLVVFMPILEEKLSFIPNILHLRDSAAATLSAQIMVVPLIAYYIGEFSVVSVLVNMLVLFMVPIVMAGGFIFVIFSLFSEFFADLFASLTNIGLQYILFIVDIFSYAPFASFSIPKFSVIFLFLYYVILYFFIKKTQTKKSGI